MGDAAEDLALHEAGLDRVTNVTKIWVTASGEKIPIKKMSDRHLINAHKMVIRKLKKYPGEQFYIGESDFADEAVEAGNRHNEHLLRQSRRAEWALRLELNSRNIDG